MAKLKLTGLEYAYIVQRKNVIDHHIPQNLNVYNYSILPVNAFFCYVGNQLVFTEPKVVWNYIQYFEMPLN